MSDQQPYAVSDLPHLDAFSDSVRTSMSPRSEQTMSPTTTYTLSYHCANELLSPTAGVDSSSMQHWQTLTGRSSHYSLLQSPMGRPDHYPVPQRPNDRGSDFQGSSRMCGAWDETPFDTGSHLTYDGMIAAGQSQSPLPMHLGNYRVSGLSQTDPSTRASSPYYAGLMSQQPPYSHEAHHSIHMPMPMHTHMLPQSGGFLGATMSEPVLQDASRSPLHQFDGSCSSPPDEPIKEEPNSNLPPQATRASRRRNFKGTARKPKATKSQLPENWVNCHGDMTLPTLKSGCPEEFRLIWELQWKYDSLKGKRMWENTQRDFKKITGKDLHRATLQMRYRRARIKWIQWEELDKQYLRQAYMAQQGNNYAMVLKEFLKLGGSRNMALNAEDTKTWCETKEFKAWREENGLKDCYFVKGTKGRKRK
ncbi:hypothetical protein E4U21_006036 [Claviceps maximensis]|nr:hypothetical protein E4U21_006036 [Claviceps maximensis]